MRGTPYVFDDLSKGVCLQDPYLTDSKQARDALNVTSRRRGTIERRGGSIAGPTIGGDGIFAFIDSVGIGRTIVSAPSIGGLNFTLMAVTVNTDGWLAITGSEMTDHGDGRWDWTSAPMSDVQGPAYGMNGFVARYYDGDTSFGEWTAATGLTLPIGKYIHYAANRLFICGAAADEVGPDARLDRDTVAASDIGDPRDWDTTDNGSWRVKLDPNDGQGITGIGSVDTQVLVFKNGKTFVIYDPDTGANRRLSDTVGCAARRSIVETPYGAFFLAEHGVWLTNGSSMKRVSEDIEPLLESIPTDRRQYAAGVWWRNRYLLSICTDATAVGSGDLPKNNLTLEYDPVENTWWIHDLAAREWAVFRQSPTADAELHGTNIDNDFQGFVDYLQADNMPTPVVGSTPVSYDAYWKSSWHTMGAPHLRKRVRELHVDGKGVLEVRASKDFEDEGLFDTVGEVPAGDEDVQTSRITSLGVARTWSVTLRGDSDAWKGYSYTMWLQPRTR